MKTATYKVRKTREQQGLSVRELADKAGVAFGYLDDIENGKVDNVSPKEMAQIAHALGTSVDSLGKQTVDMSQHLEYGERSAALGTFARRSW